MNYKSIKDEYYKKFTHTKCEYFPCHSGLDIENFNCLFCYCPLYTLGDQCGGNFVYKDSIKDCSFCLIPHSEKGYGYIMKMFNKVSELASENRRKESRPSSPAVKKAAIRML